MLLSLGKKSSIGHVLSSFYSCPKSKSMVLRKTSSPVKKKKKKKKFLVVSYRKGRKPPQFLALILCTAVFKNFLCQKKQKTKKKTHKKKQKKKRFKLEFEILLSDAIFLLVSDDGLLITHK